MSTREWRRRVVEDAVTGWLDRNGEVWVKARDLALLIENPWRSTARALSRLVARGMVRQKILLWRDQRYRPRETKLYQVIRGFDSQGWPEWAVPRVRRLPPATRPPRLPRSRADEVSPSEELSWQSEVDEFLMGARED